MKKFVTLAMLGMFVAAMAGCEANAKVGTDSSNPNAGYDKKTVTETSPNGQTTYQKTTESKTETNP